MKTFKHIGLLGALVATALMGACTNKDDYTPGPEVASGCQQVHFTNTNNPICVLNLDNANERTATLILKRNNAGAELNMPVKVVSQSAGLEIPTSVTFAAGDSLAELNIKAPQQVKLKDVYKYEVKLEGKEVDPYSKLDGGIVFSGQLNFPEAKKADFWMANGSNGLSLFNYWQETLMDLGNNNFFIKDFMHSGENLWLNTSSSGVLTVKSDSWTKASIVPDASLEGGYTFYFNKLINNRLQPYKLYPLGNTGSEPSIKELVLYGGPDYSSYSSNGTWGKIYINYAKYSNDSEDSWVYLYFQLK
ncbi:hypothetical protein [Hoylesella shahii]|uniref:hypothetical protein n=1 Tax=Hoylesella shahii TaxID=228603 RepID=UPI0028EC80FF|nr:hypothetical protein [Hoylesella shahii]